MSAKITVNPFFLDQNVIPVSEIPSLILQRNPQSYVCVPEMMACSPAIHCPCKKILYEVLKHPFLHYSSDTMQVKYGIFFSYRPPHRYTLLFSSDVYRLSEIIVPLSIVIFKYFLIFLIFFQNCQKMPHCMTTS